MRLIAPEEDATARLSAPTCRYWQAAEGELVSEAPLEPLVAKALRQKQRGEQQALVPGAVQAALRARGLELSADMMGLLRLRCEKATKEGVEATAAVETALEAHALIVQEVARALEAESEWLETTLGPPATAELQARRDESDLEQELALAVFRGERLRDALDKKLHEMRESALVEQTVWDTTANVATVAIEGTEVLKFNPLGWEDDDDEEG